MWPRTSLLVALAKVMARFAFSLQSKKKSTIDYAVGFASLLYLHIAAAKYIQIQIQIPRSMQI